MPSKRMVQQTFNQHSAPSPSPSRCSGRRRGFFDDHNFNAGRRIGARDGNRLCNLGHRRTGRRLRRGKRQPSLECAVNGTTGAATNATAVGTNSDATANSAVAVGDSAAAFGTRSFAGAADSVAVGSSAFTDGINSTAIGSNSFVGGESGANNSIGSARSSTSSAMARMSASTSRWRSG